ncbi:MAG TPA: hypothetical protein VMS93_11905, partial [Candidatus Saccharimonadales bacterium]|nr:hypothetical protein [Candidatus Saccharimonadales bacterium]
ATLAGSGHPGSRGGPSPFGQFDQPMGITVAPDGWVYVADVNNRKVRSASPAGFVAQVAGSGLSGYLDGAGEASEWKYPSGVAWLASGDLLVTDALNHRLRLVHGGLHLTAPRWPPSALRLLLRPRVGAAPARAAVRALPPGVAPAPAARFGGRR